MPGKLKLVPPQSSSEDSEKQQIADEFGDLDRFYREAKPRLDRREALSKIIKTWSAEEDPDATPVYQGKRWIVQASKQASETKIRDMNSVFAFAGRAKFLQICSVTLKSLKDLFTEETYEKLVETTQTGSRTLKAIPRAQAIAPAA